jgi:hypothetical protein
MWITASKLAQVDGRIHFCERGTEVPIFLLVVGLRLIAVLA